MNIAIALQLPLLQQGGVEVLARVFLEDKNLEDRLFLVSQDTAEALGSSPYGNLVAGHFQVPLGEISLEWMNLLVLWLKKNHVEICHFHLTGTYGWNLWTGRVNSVIAVARSGIRTVTTNHQVISHFDTQYYPRSWFRNLIGFVRHWPIKLRQLLAVENEVSVSQHDRNILRRAYPFLGFKLRQIYHSRLSEDEPFGARLDLPVILNVGTIAYRKGQHLLVKAFAMIAEQHADWKLKLVGYVAEQSCDEEIRKCIKDHQLEDRVLLHGPDPEPTKHYLEAAIYVQPSTVEGLGLSLQEAMFHRCACIGSNAGGIPELVNQPEVGQLFESGDVRALAGMLVHLIQSPTLRHKMGEAARQSIIDRGMTRQAMLRAYQHLFTGGDY